MAAIGGGASLSRGDGDPCGEPFEVHNQISGDVFGPAVQARTIHGGIHVHQDRPRLPKPAQLPPAGDLCGRSRDLSALDAASRHQTVVISGPPGIGKTALAVHWAHSRSENFRDGQLFADMRGHAPDGPAGPAEVLSRFLRALGIPPQDLPAELAELTALYRSATSGRRVVVVLDDAISAAQVRPLQPASAESMMLVTSRWRLAGLVAAGARPLQLDRLDAGAAVELLCRVLGQERVAAEQAAANELASLCAYFPLALCISAARLAVRPKWQLTELVAVLRSQRSRLPAFAAGDDVALGISLDLSYRALPAQAARIYRLMSLFPGSSFGGHIAAVAAELPLKAARDSLGLLADANMLDDAVGGRYQFHDLIRLHALAMAEEQDSETARNGAIGRMLGWYLDAVIHAGQIIAPYRRNLAGEPADGPAEPLRFSSDDVALDWLEQELPNLSAAVRFAADHGYPAPAFHLVDALWPLFLRRGLYPDRLALDRIGLAAARNADDSEAEAKMLGRYGLVLIRLGRLDEAAQCAEQALSIWRAAGNHRRVAGSFRRLALVEQARGHAEGALALFGQALEVYERLAESRALALTLTDIGAVLVDARRPAEAIGHLRRARQLAAEFPDRYNHARALATLGRALGGIGILPEAAAALDEALRTMREAHSLTGEAHVLQLLGELAEAAGQSAAARQRYQAAEEILARIRSPRAPELTERLTRLA